MDSGQCSINPKSKLVRLKRKKELARKYPKTTISNEMLQKIESTARRVMGLITQFFTLAKLEAGDIDMPLERLNANEACAT